MAPYDDDSDQDEDDGRSPVYTTRSSVHGVKQSMFTVDDDRNNLSHLAPKVSKSISIASLTGANKTLLLG